MTEFEFYEAWMLTGSEIANGTGNLVTVIFAYVIASHFVGKSLPRLVAVLVSIAYSLWVLGPLISIATSFARMQRISAEYVLSYPEGWLLFKTNLAGLMVLGVAPLFITWAGSLCFMHLYARKTNVQKNGT